MSFDELSIPDGVSPDDDPMELVRFWISKGNDYVSLRVGIFDGDLEPSLWGSIAADIAQHAVRALCQDDPTRDPAVVLAAVEKGFIERMREKSAISGTIKPTSVQ